MDRPRISDAIWKPLRTILCIGWLATGTCAATAATPETVPVGNPGNDADRTGYGAVDYEYRIGKYEVTNEEYCELLNAMAKTDRYQLYDGRMAGEYGGITRSGLPGAYTYKTKPGGERKPVSFVTWESCARYANWLSHGGGEGAGIAVIDPATGKAHVAGPGIERMLGAVDEQRLGTVVALAQHRRHRRLAQLRRQLHLLVLVESTRQRPRQLRRQADGPFGPLRGHGGRDPLGALR